MSSSTKLLVLAGLALLLGVVAWWTLGASSGARASIDREVAARVEHRDDARDLVASASERAGDPPTRASVAAPAAEPPADTAAWEEGFEVDAVYGTVLDPSARPIEGARCRLYPIHAVAGRHPDPPLAECATDAAGRFRMRELEPRLEYLVHVEAEGFRPQLDAARSGRDQEILLAQAARIRGRVTDTAGEPAAGVEVSITQTVVDADGRLLDEEVSVTGADGRYALAHARLDRVQSLRLARAASGGVPALRVEREIQVRPGVEDGYDLRLGGAHVVELALLEVGTRRPVGGVEVDLGGGVLVTPDAHGRARVAVRDLGSGRQARLDASIDGWCRTSRTIALDPPPAGPVELPMVRGGRARVLVRDAAGAPIEGAQVWISSPRRRFQDVELPPDTRITARGELTRTGADGRVEVGGLMTGPGEHHAVATFPGYRPARSQPLVLAASGAVCDVELVLERGGAIEGVITRNGEPVHALVWWSGSDDRSGQAGTDDQGAYRLEGVDPGTITLAVYVQERSWSPDQHVETVRVEDGKTTRKDFELVEARGSIAGRVIDPDGAPVSGVQVHAWASYENGEGWSSAQGRTDAAGAFEIEVKDVPGLLYQLRVVEGERRADRADVPIGTRDLELVLPRTAALPLEVVDALTRAPVERFRVYWRPSGDADATFRGLSSGRRHLAPGPNGVYEASLPVGVHDLRVSARDEGYLVAEVSQVRVEEGGRAQPVRVALERGVTLEIRFVGPSTREPPRVTLATAAQREELERGQYEPFARDEILFAQRTDPDSERKAVLRAMAPGSYTLWQPPPDLVIEPGTIDVPHVDRHVVELHWRPAPQDRTGSERPHIEGIGYLGDG